MRNLVLFIGLAQVILWGGAHPTAAASQTVPGALQLHSTMNSVGLVAPYTGDDNQNNAAWVRYKPIGASAWLPGLDLFVDRSAGEWRGSLVYLSPATVYLIEVRYTDADGVAPSVVSGTIRTQPDYPDVGGGGRVRYVPDEGDLQTVIDAASPGDTIRVHGGIYYMSADLGIEDSGTAGHYVTIEAAPGEHAILDGSAPDLNDSQVDNWHLDQGSIYYAELPWGSTQCSSELPDYVGEQRGGDDMRYLLYKGTSAWNDFLAAPSGKAFYDCDGDHPRRLYVVTYEADDPDLHEMHVSRRATGLELTGADYIRIRNLEFRYYGNHGVYLNKPGSDHCIIERNVFHGIGRYHIRVGIGVPPLYGADNLIQDNRFYERGYRESGWSWEQMKNHAATVGVRLGGAGPGNVIRRNVFKGGEDAINVSRQSHDTDVYENIIEEYMGDGIEVDDQPGYNIRVWGNKIRYCYSSISNQDWFTGSYWKTGPIFIFRNVIQGGFDPQGRTDTHGGLPGYYTNYAFKVGGDYAWPARVYYYHNTIYIPDSPSGPPWGGNAVQDSGGYHFSGIVARNNLWSVDARIFYLRWPTTVVNHDLDCDNLYSQASDHSFIQWSNSGGPQGNGVYRTLPEFQAYTGQERHAISNGGTLFNPDMSLRAGSPEIDAGCVITGFNDLGPWAFRGRKPDIGAFEYNDKPDLDTSTQMVSKPAVSTNENIRFTIRIINAGGPLTRTAIVTDVLPPGLVFLNGTLTSTLGTAWTSGSMANLSIHWRGVMSDAKMIDIGYGTRVNVSGTLAISNRAWIDDGSGKVIGRSATIIVNGWSVYLPVVLRGPR